MVKHKLSLTGFVLLVIILSLAAFSLYISINKYYEFNKNMNAFMNQQVEQMKSTVKNEIERAVDYVEFKRSQTVERLKISLKQNVNLAHQIAYGIYRQNRARHGKEEIIDMIKEALGDIRFFEGRGYFYINTYENVSVLHPIFPEYEGRSFYDILKDDNRTTFLNEFAELVKTRQEGYISYSFHDLNTTSSNVPKLGYIKRFEPYGLYIGLADYVEGFETQIQQEVLERLSNVRFGKDGYLFVDNYDGGVLMHPMKPEIIGKNLMEYQDQNGVYVVKRLIDAAKKDGGDFVYYNWNKPADTASQFNKISFAMGIDDWEWMIGGGLYLDDIIAEIEAKRRDFRSTMFKEILVLSLFLLAVTTMTYLILHWWMQRTQRTINELIRFFNDSINQSSYLDTSNIYFQEFEQLALNINKMIRSRKEMLERLNDANRRLEEKANKDYLTGLYNRRHFMEFSNHLLATAKRDHTPLFVLMIDIDHFKSVNDRYGHNAGDTVLQNVAEYLQSNLRQSDIIARYGGEEFVVILSNTDRSGAVYLAEKIRSQCERLEDFGNGNALHITISIGIGEFKPDEDHTIEPAIKRADEALYAAKATGRNRVMGPDLPENDLQ